MRKVINLLLVFMLGTTLVGCSSQIKTTKKTTENSNVKSESQTQKTYHDKEFINDVYALISNSELDKDYSDVDFDNLSQQEKDKVIKDQQIVFIQQKIDKIKKYKKLDFKNPELKELAIRYIDVLETQKQLIEDDKDTKVLSNGEELKGALSYAWLQCEDDECEIILELANNHGLKMSEHLKKDLEDIRSEVKQEISNYKS